MTATPTGDRAVCVLGYGLHPPWSEGTRVLTRDVVRSLLHTQGIDVSCLSTIGAGATPAEELPITYVRESVVGDLVEHLGGYRYNTDVVMLARLFRRFIAQARKAEVVHAGFASHTMFSALADAVSDAAFVAQTFGGIEHADLAKRLGTFDRIDAYVSCSRGDLETLRELGVPERKLHAVDAPVFTTDFDTPGSENARAEFAVDDGDFVVGYLGNVNERRFPRAVAARIEEFADRSDVTVLVATKLIEDHPFSNASGVTVVNRYLDPREKRLFFRACDVLLFPFDFDDRTSAPIIDPPLSVLEAMAAARPVVTTRCLSLPTLLQDGETGYLREPGDVDGLLDAISRLADRPEERRRIGRAARDVVETRHAPETVATQLREVYDEVVP
ncbi:glycosyltransferase family 4 protein [Haloplanus pelagicus]|uniref:glycosyltransferase family 4 protein n=1 Tax=Haloplanus pelagicus TaxID=2949995 RepID=UPI002041265C|nr:glycosyltransferase family 4 protein [Haloplanus sp. HW8-1]